MIITDEAVNKLRGYYDKVRGEVDFGNGRFVRKMLEEAEMNLAERLLELDEESITEDMMTTIEVEDIPEMPEKAESFEKRIGFAS